MRLTDAEYLDEVRAIRRGMYLWCFVLVFGFTMLAATVIGLLL